jgi:alcohol dehydrogenase, propanol-preferring
VAGLKQEKGWHHEYCNYKRRQTWLSAIWSRPLDGQTVISPHEGHRIVQDAESEVKLQMAKTYKAVEVSAPGSLRVVERTIPDPGPGQVRIRVEACGVCHTDAATVMGIYPGLTLPRVPGHEVVGRIEALGSGVSRWKVGQRVGVGLIAGEDGVCEPCRRGDLVNCQNPVVSGVTTDGGYAEVMIAEARALSSVPDELTSAEAAPLLCAGITTYNALRNAGLRGGDLVAVQGVGGLGHLGIQFARHMGFRTVAIGRGGDKEKLAKDLGAHVYIDAAAEDAAAALQRMGGARAILATGTSGNAMGTLVSGLSARGKLIVVGVPQDQIQLNAFPLVFGGRSIHGSLTGTPIDGEDTLAFSVLENIRPMIETVPLEQAADAYARMMQGKARFRMVLVTNARDQTLQD